MIEAERAIAALPPNARVLVQGGASESLALAEAFERAGRRDLAFTGVFFPGVNRQTYGAAGGARVTTFFMTPELKAAGPNVEFLPLSYTDIGAYLRAARFDACVSMLTPPDQHGMCSFGPAVDFLAELWPQIPIRIAHINANLPRTNAGAPFDVLSHAIESPTPLWQAPPERDDQVTQSIAQHFSELVPDGATLQAGIGKLPGACLCALAGKRGLRVHSGLVGDWVIDLMEAGALADAPVVTGLALGTDRLYAALNAPRFVFKPASHTHAPLVMSSLANFITLNSALEVDLLGQVHAEVGVEGIASGPGGALDFARGAKLAGGVRVIALPASAAKGAVSRIVAAGRGPVSLSRFDSDIIITEFGAADMRGLGHDSRAEALIAIADPNHRESLRAAWGAYRADVLKV